MIVVIADDFTGAAEIAGIGLRFGLRTEIQTNFNPTVCADLLIIDSNTRSVGSAEARRRIKFIATLILSNRIEWLYKKVDSMLRGNILTELAALQEILPQKDILLVPANPRMGRVISKGKYYINSIPIDKTDFIKDPDFPRKSALVLEMLAMSETVNVKILNLNDDQNVNKIVLGEATSFQDLESWAKRLTPQILSAGGSEFFISILKNKGLKKTIQKNEIMSLNQGKKLLVCGSSSKQSSRFFKRLKSDMKNISMIPCVLNFSDGKMIEKYQNRIDKAYSHSNLVILFIDEEINKIFVKPKVLTGSMTKTTEWILNEFPFNELIIEGGNTASSILRKMHWESLIPVKEWKPGVVTMHIKGKPGFFLTTKPGSYLWPRKLVHNWMQC